MKKVKLLLLVLSLLIASACSSAESRKASSHDSRANASHQTETARGPQTIDAHGHDHGADASRVPAFENDPKNLPPTLDPSKFTGLARQAYQAVSEIPETIAQLPCYCYCDKGFGHKSLHSCYVDNHAAGCDVCVREVLMAYDLQKKEGLKPEQIRERIIAKYSNPQ